MVNERVLEFARNWSNPTAAKRILLAAAAGVCLAAAFPPYHCPLVIPFGVFLLLSAIRGTEVRYAGYLGFLTGMVFYGATAYWLWNIFQAAAIALLAILAGFVMLFCILNTWSLKRFPKLPEWLISCALWTGIEYFRSELFSLNFGWMGLGYATAGFPVTGAVASWIGSYGLSFYIVMLGSSLVTGKRANRWGLFAFLLLWAPSGVILYPGITNNLFHGNLPVRLVQTGGDDSDEILRLAKTPAPSNGTQPPQLSAILLPEYMFLVDPMRDKRTRTQVETLAKEMKCVLVFGGKDFFDAADPNRYRNTAYVLGPDGKLLGMHVKNHPIHFFNDGVRGTEAKAIDTPMGRIGVAICFDMDYPEVARKLAQDGAEVFLVPNMDPPHWGRLQREQHRLMFAMRAAECGKWLARADVAGGTSVVDPFGRELRRVNSQEAQVLDVRVQLVRGKTVYVRFGWMLGPGCLLLSCLLVLGGMFRSRQTI